MERRVITASIDSQDFLFFQVIRALIELKNSGRRISFYSVAEQSHVARSTLYRRNDLKQLVMSARSNPDEFIPPSPTTPTEMDAGNNAKCSAPPAKANNTPTRNEEVTSELIDRIAALEKTVANLLREKDAGQQIARHRYPECHYAIISLSQAA